MPCTVSGTDSRIHACCAQILFAYRNEVISAFFFIARRTNALTNEPVFKTTTTTMAGLGNDPVQVYRTLRDLHREFLRLWTGFELPSSWTALPCYVLDLNRNSFCVMRWPHILTSGHRISTTFNGQIYLKQIAGSKVLDEDYNTYLRT
jgi:hypothetical protein